MPERINTPFTNEHFAAFCLSMLSQPYWYGTVVYKCTESLRSRKANQYPSHYKDNRTARYKQDIAAKKVCADCVGGCKGYAWTGGGIGVVEAIGTDKPISSKYGGNCPDKSANGMFSYAKSKGMFFLETTKLTGQCHIATLSQKVGWVWVWICRSGSNS